MTDQALLAEWNCTTCNASIEDARTSALAAEMEKREIDF